MVSSFLHPLPQRRAASCVTSLLVLAVCSAFRGRVTGTSYPHTRSGSSSSRRIRAGTATSFVLALHERAPDTTSRRFSGKRGPSSTSDNCMATKASPGLLRGHDYGKLCRRWSTHSFAPLSLATIAADRRRRVTVGVRRLDAVTAGDGVDPDDYLALAPVEVIDSIDSYFEVLSTNADKIVVVKIFAGFCRACKAFDKKYRALALEYEEAEANIKFFEMDWIHTRDLCKSLQVKKLPHMEIYAGERGRLASFVCGPSKSGLLKDKLERLLADPSDPSLGTAPPALSPTSLSPP